MLGLSVVPSQQEESRPALDEWQYLEQRMRKPQRHRLLHGYPLAAALHRRENSRVEDDLFYDPAAGRSLLVGVLPHPFCNPAVAGCGFCTFPHQKYRADRATEVVAHVTQEIEQRLTRQPDLHRRRVSGLYFGGGTANLAPPDAFRQLCRTLTQQFDLSGAEVTLEGVPIYFLKGRSQLIDIMREEIPARHFRLSMGVQSFEEAQLARMGRLAFGNAATFAEVVESAHRLGFTISADLLFNLPHQTLAQMQADVQQAIDIGLDHLGLYHLVLFRGIGTEWSRDENLLAGLPTNEQAADHWLHLREYLLQRGFDQTTLTNFERREFRAAERRFVYEEFSFRPDRYDVLGFGPSAISFAASRSFRSGFKILNPEGAEEYVQAVAGGKSAWDRYFEYDERDMRVFYLTRRLAALSIDQGEYQERFGSEVTWDFVFQVSALEDAQLIDITEQGIKPTPRGMFYADSIAALLAWRTLQRRRGWQIANDNGRHHM